MSREAQSSLSARKVRLDGVERAVQIAVAHCFGDQRVFGKDGFVVLPIFGSTGQPEYQIELHLGRTDGLTLDELDVALRSAQERLTPGVA